MNSTYIDNFGDRFDKLSDNFLSKPVLETNSFNQLPTPSSFDEWKNPATRINIDANGYALNETTSLGVAPNPLIEKKDFGGGMFPPNHGINNGCFDNNDFGTGMFPPVHGQLNHDHHFVGQPITPPAYSGVYSGGYFVPNADYMKPASNNALDINMPMHP